MTRPRHLSCLALLLACVHAPAQAQLNPTQPDALGKLQAAQQASTACSATEASSCAAVAAKLMPIILGDSPMVENLRKLTDEIGGRESGSAEMAKAEQWGIAGFRAAGVEVHRESYTLPTTWKEGATKLSILSPAMANPNLRAVSQAWAPATPPGGLDGSVIDLGYGEEADFAKAGASLEGRLLLIEADRITTFDELYQWWARAPAIVERAVKSKAAAILWTGARDRLLLYRDSNSIAGEIDKIPQAVVAREDALRLARTLAAYPGKVRVHLDLPNQIGGPIEQHNLVAEIRGYDKPDQAVILGAHLDSWELGAGALDNGCSAAMVVEAARAIKATGLLPRRTIRFVLFSAEELGMVGSHEYVKAHRAELDNIRAMITFDAGTGRFTGYSLGGRRDTEAGIREILRPLESWDVNHHTYDASISTDDFDFFLEGVPTLAANQDQADYLLNYHAASDTFDKVDLRAMKLHTVIAALTAWGVADRAEPLGKRLTRAEVDAHLKETGLDKQLKSYGLWEAWQSGERGRQP